MPAPASERTGSVVGSGALMAKLASGFGLTASAAALDGAAVQLISAATIMKGGPVSEAIKNTAATGTAAAGGGLWAAGAAALPWLAAGGSVAASLGVMRLATQDAGYDGMKSGERMTKQRGGSMRDTYRKTWGYDGVSGPEVSQTMTYGTGAGGNGGPLTATLTGSADVKGEAQVTVKVEAGSSLLQVVEQAKSALKLAGTLNANGPGSVGKSSPDARSNPSVGASGLW